MIQKTYEKYLSQTNILKLIRKISKHNDLVNKTAKQRIFSDGQIQNLVIEFFKFRDFVKSKDVKGNNPVLFANAGKVPNCYGYRAYATNLTLFIKNHKVKYYLTRYTTNHIAHGCGLNIKLQFETSYKAIPKGFHKYNQLNIRHGGL